MGGLAKSIGQGISDVATLGTDRIKGSPMSKIGNTIGSTLTLGQSKQPNALFPGLNGPGNSSPTQAGLSDNPAQTLATSGGAPLLANIALGASVEQTLAGYFGKSDYGSFYNGLSDSDKQLVDGVKNQLNSIQNNTELRNQAVQKVVNDFPGIATQAAQARQASGEEFDATTKGYIDQALQGTAAKYASGGNLSSGAMNEATAKVGAQYGMDKLNYMDSRGQTAYDQGLQGWQARYNETNALRGFQNLMTQGAAGNGFSAVQASLGRTQQTNLANAGFANQQNIQNQQNSNAMFGAIGSLAGTAIGASVGGPVGAGIGGSIGRAAGSGASTGGMGGASDYGFSGVTSPGYQANNNLGGW